MTSICGNTRTKGATMKRVANLIEEENIFIGILWDTCGLARLLLAIHSFWLHPSLKVQSQAMFSAIGCRWCLKFVSIPSLEGGWVEIFLLIHFFPSTNTLKKSYRGRVTHTHTHTESNCNKVDGGKPPHTDHLTKTLKDIGFINVLKDAMIWGTLMWPMNDLIIVPQPQKSRKPLTTYMMATNTNLY